MSRNPTNRIDVTDIDFNNIRNDLKEYLRSQEIFEDYDFEGSALSTLIDALAYVTHYNAVNANIGLNEAFLNTAQFRGSVVGHARTLGYTPRSASAPAAFIRIEAELTPGTELIIPRGHAFKAVINGTTYPFVTVEEYTSSTGIFESVKIVQGEFKSAEYIYDIRSSEKFIIPEENVDTSTLLVEVFDAENVNTKSVFARAKQVTSITSETPVYFLSENPDGKFEVSFGDGVLGKRVEDGNVLRFDYLTTRKDEANGARRFTLVDDIVGATNVNITTLSGARGGSDKESIESIRRNAPITFAAQNRGVTPQDYEAIIRENFDNVSSVKVWGGEDNDPPVYGKVFVSIQPKDTDILSTDEKDEILRNILIPKSAVTITPEIIDPEILFITFEIFFKYDPTITNLTETQLENKVRESVLKFNEENLNRFNAVFRYSKFLKAIDQTDPAILNSFSRIYMQKRFIPEVGVKRIYEIDFSNPLFESTGTRSVIFNSSLFTVAGFEDCRLKDFLSEDGKRIVNVVRGVGVSEQIVQRNVGHVTRNKIILNNFVPSAFRGLSIQIEVIPDSYDLVATKNNILVIDCQCDRFNVSGSVDTIVSGSEFSGIDYETPSKYA